MGTGNTDVFSRLCRSRAVQPRGYGEHHVEQQGAATQDGSAPWVRGTLIAGAMLALKNRFSPVGTGNTIVRVNPQTLPAVQPRGYGEHHAH